MASGHGVEWGVQSGVVTVIIFNQHWKRSVFPKWSDKDHPSGDPGTIPEAIEVEVLDEHGPFGSPCQQLVLLMHFREGFGVQPCSVTSSYIQPLDPYSFSQGVGMSHPCLRVALPPWCARRTARAGTAGHVADDDDPRFIRWLYYGTL